ncbi:MAG: hypothetical protein CVU57_28265 [Deltaproteobacteria bacterium HGW-Deltaproteobacteria-15]|nr:MAG: hypothetical protein CVU57_28265 [Deltaproteobacteria bacterium HGW-Deltaproteobacteria-15]
MTFPLRGMFIFSGKGWTMQIGKLAKKVGVSTRVIRYYERIGLLGKTHRSASGYMKSL